MVPDKYGYKRRFVELKAGDKNYPRCFNRCADFEEHIVDKDICEFKVDEFVSLIENLLNKKAPSTVEGDVSRLKEYLEYCAKHSPSYLREKDIQKLIKQNGGGVKKWLATFPTPAIVNNLFSFNELLSLDKRPDITYQMLAAVWLLFIGLNVEEIRCLEEKDIDDWEKWYRKGMGIPAGIKAKVSTILSLARDEVRISRDEIIDGRKQRTTLFNQSKYLIKKAYGEFEGEGEGDSIPSTTLASYFDAIEQALGKTRLHETNIRKSGMLYFANLLLTNSEPIETYDQRKLLIFEPIRKRFDEETTYETSLYNLLYSSALPIFYGQELPRDLIRTNRKPNGEPAYLLDDDEQPPRQPKERNDEQAQWKQNIQRGMNGEETVLTWIRSEFDSAAIQVNDYKGYDIYAVIDNQVRLIEVKTLETIPGDIHITRNEYKVAHTKSKYYWFYIVVLNDEGKKTIYIFNNLLSLLCLQDKDEELFMQNEKYGVEYGSFIATLKADVFENCAESIGVNA